MNSLNHVLLIVYREWFVKWNRTLLHQPISIIVGLILKWIRKLMILICTCLVLLNSWQWVLVVCSRCRSGIYQRFGIIVSLQLALRWQSCLLVALNINWFLWFAVIGEKFFFVMRKITFRIRFSLCWIQIISVNPGHLNSFSSMLQDHMIYTIAILPSILLHRLLSGRLRIKTCSNFVIIN